jgi:hypothetical protein
LGVAQASAVASPAIAAKPMIRERTRYACMSSAPSQFFLYGHWHIVRTAAGFANAELRLSKQAADGRSRAVQR